MTNLLARLLFFLGAGRSSRPLADGQEGEARAGRALSEAIAAAGRARRALAESEARLRLALVAADVSTYEVDLGRGLAWIDQRAAAVVGDLLPANLWFSMNDPRLHEFFTRIHRDDRPARKAALRDVIEGRTEMVALTYRFRAQAGDWRWLAERGAVVARRPDDSAPLRIVGVVRDVTEQRDQARALEQEVAARTAALRESERRFRCLFDSAFQLTGLLARDGTLLAANRAALELLGVTEAEAVGRPVDELGPWRGTAAAVRLCAALARAAAGAFVREEVTLEDGAGRARVFDCSLKPVPNERGETAMLVAEARDVTERHGLQAQLAHAQKMEAVGQLTGGVAHDFNNLLQTLTGNLDLIRRHAEAAGDARLQQLAVSAERAVARGARLTQRLLAFSRRRNAHPERVQVGRLVAEMTELLHRAAGETVRLETRAAADLWSCHLDPAQFEAALLNLVINARDAMPRGGVVAISAANALLADVEAAKLDVTPGAYVRVDIADTGTGIAPEYLARLFEPFFTTKPEGKGTGLGLAMVHGFVRQSGGAVTVASLPNEGTTFSLFLPAAGVAAPVRPPSPPRPPSAPPPQNGPGLDILVVEDDAEVREAVQFALADAGHRVVAAQDASAALDMLANGHALDLLVCDVALPDGASGLAVADAARRLRPEMRILLASGYGDALENRDGYEVLPKPFGQAELLRRVDAFRPQVAAG